MKITDIETRPKTGGRYGTVAIDMIDGDQHKTLQQLCANDRDVVIVAENRYQALLLAKKEADTVTVTVEGRDVSLIPEGVREFLDRSAQEEPVDIQVEMTPFIEAGINEKILEAFEKCAQSMETLKRSALSATKLRAYARQRYGPKTPEELGAEMLVRLNDSNSVAEAMDIAAKYVREYGEASEK